MSNGRWKCKVCHKKRDMNYQALDCAEGGCPVESPPELSFKNWSDEPINLIEERETIDIVTPPVTHPNVEFEWGMPAHYRNKDFYDL